MGESPDKVRRDGEGEEELSADSAGTGSSSTVQLRVRDVDSRTTMLRLPVDNATTMLKLPEEAEAEAVTSPDKPEAESAEPVEEPRAVDPRLAVRDAKDEADVAGSEVEPEVEVEAAEVAEVEVAEVAEVEAEAPEAVAEAGPVKLAKPPVQVWTVPEPAALPAEEPPAPLPMPETTSEAMEVLAALSARPVSPFRRGVKRVTVWSLFVAVVIGAVVAAQLLRPLPDPKVKLSLAGSYTFTGSPLTLPWPAKGQAAAEVVGVGSLGSSGPETPAPIASVTKVMNAHLILRAHPLKKGEPGPVITVDKQAAAESSNVDESRAQLTEGQKLSEFEALELLMLPSANNVARLLARWDSGSEAEFVKKMNDEAKALGMTNTTYADPAGYNNDTKSTAKDQLKLAGQVMQDDVFRQVVATPDMTFNGQRIYNTNGLLSAKNGVIGIKTGSSTPAGSCLMWAAVKEIGGTKRMILGVTLGQPAGVDNLLKAAQTVSQKIITAAQDGLTGQTLAKQGQVVGYVDDGLGGQVPVVATKDLTVAGWSGITAQLTMKAEQLGHTVKAGTPVGTIAAGEGEGKVEVPVTLQSDLAPPSIMSRLLRIM
ncbi:D-alanyl-D-alanine carboxypeptidase [Kitasatospora gansuensis]|uniref:serine-type D-Ala-D-Ala carboxypeptidase n=1 Tax=Kitasatospora gansuensis TaxID=258050 RepID=A0A7W7WH37_9ACTN|nr:D-alanyl-D-alanine carboxypeptidase [Kitasatospora gansuensis]MBB4947367.1 D-alanyl-D-alanine carboxypeptidase [Kitasatospora gansuensis]